MSLFVSSELCQYFTDLFYYCNVESSLKTKNHPCFCRCPDLEIIHSAILAARLLIEMSGDYVEYSDTVYYSMMLNVPTVSSNSELLY